MPKITEITREFLRDARTEMMEDLKAFGERHGLTVTVGNASFTAGVGGNATFKVELATQAADGTANTQAVVDFNRCASLYGLKPHHLNMTFDYGGEKYKLVGLNPKAHKLPLIAQQLRNGKTYKMPITAFKAALMRMPQGAGGE